MTTFIQISDRLRAAADIEAETPITVGAMDPIEAEVLKELAACPELSEVCRVLSFNCYRKTTNGSKQEVKVEIHDRGRGPGRYMGFARTKDGREACSNQVDDLFMAVNGIHWNELDALAK